MTIPRKIAVYLCREITGISFPRLGEFFGRDHSSIIHACHEAEKLLASNPHCRRRIAEVRATFEGEKGQEA